MKRYSTGTQVEGGYYWNGATWHIAVISGEKGLLEGEAGESFVRLPLPLVALVALSMSFLFVVFLPFIGFALLAYALVRPLLRPAERAFQSVMATLAPAWRPGEAYFAGKPQEDAKAQDAQAPGSESLTALQAEVERRRRQEETGPSEK